MTESAACFHRMNTKAPPTNAIQRSKLLQMVDENPVLITRKLTNQFTFEMFNNLWVQVKEELNRLSPCKEVKGWQKVPLFIRNVI